jgi:CheY-like chemotaxis protein
MRLLLVDDDQNQRNLVSSWLSRRGWSVNAVASGQGAVERMIAQPDEYDVVLVDNILGSSDWNGVETARRL